MKTHRRLRRWTKWWERKKQSRERGRGSHAGSSDDAGGDACGQHNRIMEEAVDKVRKGAEEMEDWREYKVVVAVLVER